MNAAICTVFEGSYHYGVGALANSLYNNGFRGTIYAGYRGALPPWVDATKAANGCVKHIAADGLTLEFLPLSTTAHLTNYKPDFMLSLWQNQCADADSLFFFDPDIIVICPWTFFTDWVKAGVALCADINPSMPVNHPIRDAWKRFYVPSGISFRREMDIYFNGGFCGLRKAQIEFLEVWKKLQELMSPEIGGMKSVNVRDRTYLFHKTDQDALNVAAMVSESPVSPMGQDGMDFQQGGGGYVMTHALGGNKPWKKKFLSNLLLHGHAPSRTDRAFFRQTQSPIQLYSSGTLAWKRFFLLAASFLGRFVSKD